jgi:hypothetical protein
VTTFQPRMGYATCGSCLKLPQSGRSFAKKRHTVLFEGRPQLVLRPCQLFVKVVGYLDNWLVSE